MLVVFRQSRNFIKQAFKENGFTVWNVIYVFLLIIFWRYVRLVLYIQGTYIGIGILLIIPAYLFIRHAWILTKEKREKKEKYNKNKNNLHAEKYLNTHQLEYIENILLSNQLDLFYDVLLPSLNILNGVLSTVEVGKNEHGISITLFDKKFDEICLAFKRLKGLLEICSRHANKTRDIAITTFVFYRVLYRNVVESFYQHHGNKGYFETDPYILLKRMPSKLMLYLGSQRWRIYELQEVIYGSLRNLKLNRDLSEILIKVCDEEAKNTKGSEDKQVSIRGSAVSSKNKAKNEKNELAKHAKNELEIKSVFNEAEKNNEEDKQHEESEKDKKNKKDEKEADSFSESVKSSKKREGKSEPTVSKNQNKKDKNKKIDFEVNHFIAWLQEKIESQDKRFRLNTGGLVFSQFIKYGRKAVFVTEHVLNKYQSINQVSAKEIKQALLNARLTDNKSYYAKIENANIQLILIRGIHAEHENLSVTIEEESDGS